jgi:hypothetical protein
MRRPKFAEEFRGTGYKGIHCQFGEAAARTAGQIRSIHITPAVRDTRKAQGPGEGVHNWLMLVLFRH